MARATDQDTRNWHGEMGSPLGALHPDGSIDLKFAVRQARSWTKKKLARDSAYYAARGIPLTFHGLFREFVKEIVERCERRIDYLQWQKNNDDERSKSEVHALCVDLGIAIEVQKHAVRSSPENIRALEDALHDAVLERDLIERSRARLVAAE